MALKLKIIINPSSGRETARINIEDMLSYLVTQGALERADLYYTAKRYDAEKFAKETPAGVYDYIIGVGGDGTVNEVVTGLIKSGIDIPLGIYTSGTVNDFATINKLPNTPSDFARMLISPKIKKVDCGKCNDRYFLNVVAGGLMADVAYKVPSELKTAMGPAAYWISAVKDFQDIKDSIPLKIKANGDTIKTDAVMFLVSNTTSVGGFRTLMTQADIQDGLLDVLIIKKLNITDIMPLLGKLVVGDHLNSDSVIYIQTDKLELSSSKKKVVLDLDGEKGPVLPATIECIPKAIKLLVPGKEK